MWETTGSEERWCWGIWLSTPSPIHTANGSKMSRTHMPYVTVMDSIKEEYRNIMKRRRGTEHRISSDLLDLFSIVGLTEAHTMTSESNNRDICVHTQLLWAKPWLKCICEKGIWPKTKGIPERPSSNCNWCSSPFTENQHFMIGFMFCFRVFLSADTTPLTCCQLHLPLKNQLYRKQLKQCLSSLPPTVLWQKELDLITPHLHLDFRASQ